MTTFANRPATLHSDHFETMPRSSIAHRHLAPSLAAALLLASALPSRAQSTAATQPVARPGDVASPDAIIAALYDVISGPKGQKRDLDRFRSLFAPGARLMPTGPHPGGGIPVQSFSPEDYARLMGPGLEATGFFEREIARTSESFGNILHAFSTYESRRTKADVTPFQRGINSIQLLKDGSRWWVVTIYWDAERPGNPIPARYLRTR